MSVQQCRKRKAKFDHVYGGKRGKNGRESTRDKRHQGISAIVKQPAEYMESGDGPPGTLSIPYVPYCALTVIFMWSICRNVSGFVMRIIRFCAPGSPSDGEVCQYIDSHIPRSVPFLDFSRTNKKGADIWDVSVAREHITLLDSPLCQMILFKRAENTGGY